MSPPRSFHSAPASLRASARRVLSQQIPGTEATDPSREGLAGRHGEGATSGRAGWLQGLPWAGLGARHQCSHTGSMPKAGQAAPHAGLWESPGPRARDLNMLTALSARPGVTSSRGQGAAQLLAPAKEAQGRPLEPTWLPPRGPPCPPCCHNSVCACEHGASLSELRAHHGDPGRLQLSTKMSTNALKA